MANEVIIKSGGQDVRLSPDTVRRYLVQGKGNVTCHAEALQGRQDALMMEGYQPLPVRQSDGLWPLWEAVLSSGHWRRLRNNARSKCRVIDTSRP